MSRVTTIVYRHSRLIAGFIAGLIVLGLFVAAKTLSADMGVFGINEDIVRAVAHFGGFGVIAVLIAMATRNRLIIAGVVTLLIGAAEEIHQAFVPGRYASLGDWSINAAGVVVFLLVFATLLPTLRRMRRRGLAAMRGVQAA